MKYSKEIPLNLQFFASKAKGGEQQAQEPTGGGEQQTQEPTGGGEQQAQEPTGGGEQQAQEPTGGGEQQTEATAQELLARIAKLEREKEKREREAAEYRKKYNEKLSEKEKIDLEKAEREAERDERIQQLERENRINRLEKNYLTLGYTSDEATKMAVAEVDGEEEIKLKIMQAVDERKKKEYEAEFIRSRPQLNAGTGDGRQITKEQFASMGMAEKSKLYRENPEEYKRLNAMK